jgi:hypothetical protein
MKNFNEILETSLLGDIDDVLADGDKLGKSIDNMESIKSVLETLITKTSKIYTNNRLNDCINRPLENGDIVFITGVSKVSNWPGAATAKRKATVDIRLGVVSRLLSTKNIEVFVGIDDSKSIDYSKPYAHMIKLSVKQDQIILAAKSKDAEQFINQLK